MDYALIGAICGIVAAAVAAVIAEIRRGRKYLTARLDAHTEALRLIAQLVRVELPAEPRPPEKPDLRIVRGVTFLAGVSAAALAWGGRHLRTVTVAAAALAVGLLVVLAHNPVPDREYAAPARPSAVTSPLSPTAVSSAAASASTSLAVPASEVRPSRTPAPVKPSPEPTAVSSSSSTPPPAVSTTVSPPPVAMGTPSVSCILEVSLAGVLDLCV